MPRKDAHREDPRRQWTLWVLLCADMTRSAPLEAAARIESAFVGARPEATPREATAYFRVDRVEDHLPEDEEWAAARARVLKSVQAFEENAVEVDRLISEASPRWRIERMPPIDRNLLRLGVTELVFSGKPHPRATINGLIELGKRLGSETTPAFVNGILDQIRRNLEIPFA